MSLEENSQWISILNFNKRFKFPRLSGSLLQKPQLKCNYRLEVQPF